MRHKIQTKNATPKYKCTQQNTLESALLVKQSRNYCASTPNNV